MTLLLDRLIERISAVEITCGHLLEQNKRLTFEVRELRELVTPLDPGSLPRQGPDR